MAKKKKKTLQLSKSLVLNRFILAQLGVHGFDALAENLKESHLEGRDENNISKYYHELLLRQHETDDLKRDQLLEYDQNIVGHTLRINEKRKDPIEWKYFQYLGLLFTEIYLDRFFSNRVKLLEDLNQFLDRWNDPLDQYVPNESGVSFTPFQFNDLNKLAFWNATGSGKTLLMHVNILQFEFYRKKYSGDKINKVLLVTPNEGLSQQHFNEFQDSDIPASYFSKRSGGAFSGTEVEIIEISKLKDEHGDKTVDVEAFERNNLVLIDEGHRGVAGDDWKRRRDYLSTEGFAFEYSATFGQAVSAAKATTKKSLVDEYSRNIIFDYSYYYFYRDGYGKDYHILNVPDDSKSEFLRKYLTGALLSFYQQKLVFAEHPHQMREFNLENPLWVFVGGTVSKSLSKKESSDILQILEFFAEFIKDSSQSKEHLQQLINGGDGIVDQQNHSVFSNYFDYLRNAPKNIDELYTDILKKVFNTEVAGAGLYVDNLNGIEGELGLRVGDANYFGVINIGADKDLFKLLQKKGIPGLDKDFGSSLFHKINEKDSEVNLLIGAKKFTEGWSSWRVSTMGLMNIGRGEGSQIIQLFGRGVRLKGYNWSLKRSRELDQYQKPDEKIPAYIRLLETLNIFGIRADYMNHFKQYLEEEGLPSNDGQFQKLQVPVMPNIKLDDQKLKVLRIRDGVDFKKDRVIELQYHEDQMLNKVKLDWYPKVQALSTVRGNTALMVEEQHEASLSADNLAFLDWDRIYFEIQKFKNERTWHNISISKQALQQILQKNGWYELYIPKAELEPTSFSKVRLWQEIAVALLKGYVDRFYNYHKSDYLSKHMETIELTPDHPNFTQEYEVEIEQSQKRIIENLQELVVLIKKGSLEKEFEIGQHFTAFEFLQHLYRPLLYLDEKKYKNLIRISPVALNEGEILFVKDLKRWYEANPDELKGRQLYLMRNQSRSGIGFFEAHGFFPDFLLWIVEKDHQYISFIDPKGLRQIIGFEHPKMRFYRTIREEIEPRLEDKSVTLNSFILSMTPYAELKHWKGQEGMADFNTRHIYFRNEQKATYLSKLIAASLDV